ncbi:UNVERIFIED_CONTAM: hypothetical protein NCL1_34691 [Trichonephila clavipes]
MEVLPFIFSVFVPAEKTAKGDLLSVITFVNTAYSCCYCRCIFPFLKSSFNFIIRTILGFIPYSDWILPVYWKVYLSRRMEMRTPRLKVLFTEANLDCAHSLSLTYPFLAQRQLLFSISCNRAPSLLESFPSTDLVPGLR